MQDILGERRIFYDYTEYSYSDFKTNSLLLLWSLLLFLHVSANTVKN